MNELRDFMFERVYLRPEVEDQRRRAEEFSFALAVVLTPAVIAKEGYRFYQAYAGATDSLLPMLAPSLLGMAASFVAGLVLPNPGCLEAPAGEG